MKVLNKTFCLGLVLILLLHTNYLAVYYSLYEINTEELTASCCEKIVVNCNAHCYLDKKMNDQEDKSNKGTSTDIKLKITEYIVSGFLPELNPDNLKIFYQNNNFSQVKGHYSEIEHPPKL